MTHSFSKARSVHLLALAALALGGCAGHSDLMIKVPQGAAPISAASNLATIVFVRDSGFGFAVNFSVVDQAGNLLGDAVARSHFGLQLPAGRYFFFARGGANTDVVQADVAPGLLYYVRVVPHFGAWLARVELHPIKPNEEEWRTLPTWLEQTQRLMPLIPKAAASVSDAPLPDWASKAWSSLGPSDRAARTLAPADGRRLAPTPPTEPKSDTSSVAIQSAPLRTR